MENIQTLPPGSLIARFGSRTEVYSYLIKNPLMYDAGRLIYPKSKVGEVYHIICPCKTENEVSRATAAFKTAQEAAKAHYRRGQYNSLSDVKYRFVLQKKGILPFPDLPDE